MSLQTDLNKWEDLNFPVQPNIYVELCEAINSIANPDNIVLLD